jgi:hypothetical protein
VLCANADKMLMRTVQQNVFLILNRVPVTFVADPELIRPSIPVMTHSLDQKVMARKAMCVLSPHNSAGMLIIMWCQIVKLLMIRLRKVSSNCFRWIDSQDRMAFKNC